MYSKPLFTFLTVLNITSDSPLPQNRLHLRPGKATDRAPASKHVSATRNPSNARPLRSPPESRLKMSEFEERLASLETTISALSHTQTSNSATLDRISSLLDTLVPGNPSAASPAAPTTPSALAQPLPTPPPPPRSGSHIRPSPPPIYDGARSGGRAFWNACQLYFSLTTGQFPDDHARISWVLSFMQHGRAADFVSRVFQYGLVKRAFPAWSDFASNFEKEFFLFDEVADAALTLESTVMCTPFGWPPMRRPDHSKLLKDARDSIDRLANQLADQLPT
ncbi:hypothetical protein D9615_009687 [Tricholomella constricta]|uniref:Uncharacterized protein n=1 Tax=Tricholomella constricta TaxID=117010 RepID=A0A8H5LVS7_9AGAR|nr:hypothetical protein D9615_009687 [Tricholomella constricta]